MDRNEIEKEVMRLQARCYTEEGKAGIVTDYIMRLLRQQESQLTMREPDGAVCTCAEFVESVFDPTRCAICRETRPAGYA
jgi:predicted Zn-ribbon and HTH transcriptional regulator